MGLWFGPRAPLDVLTKSEPLPLLGIENRIVQPVAYKQYRLFYARERALVLYLWNPAFHFAVFNGIWYATRNFVPRDMLTVLQRGRHENAYV